MIHLHLLQLFHHPKTRPLTKTRPLRSWALGPLSRGSWVLLALLTSTLSPALSWAGSLIVVSVRDTHRKPVPGVRVSINGDTAGVTDRRGKLTKEGPSGALSVTLEKAGFETRTVKKNCRAGSLCSIRIRPYYPAKVPVTFSLGPYGAKARVTATLKDKRGRTQKTFFFGGTPGSRSLDTDHKGRLTAKLGAKLYPGTYEVVADGPRLQTRKSQVTVKKPATFQLEVQPKSAKVELRAKEGMKVCLVNETLPKPGGPLCRRFVSSKWTLRALPLGRYQIFASRHGVGPTLFKTLELKASNASAFSRNVSKLLSQAHHAGLPTQLKPRERRSAAFIHRFWLQVGLAAAFAVLLIGGVFLITAIKRHRRTHDAEGTPLENLNP